MKRLTLVTLVLLFLTFCATAFAGESQLKKATNVINEIMGTPDKGIPDELLERSVCVGIVPSQFKFAFGFGGSYGRGVLVCRKGGNGAWAALTVLVLQFVQLKSLDFCGQPLGSLEKPFGHG